MLRSLLVTLMVGLSCLTPAFSVEYRKVEHAGKSFTVCRVDLREERLQLFHKDEKGEAFKRFDRLAPWLLTQNQRLVFAMNAGMYHGDFSAVGWYVADRREHSPLNLASDEGNFFLKPNGVFAITDAGAQVVESSEARMLREVILATQSGPLLLRQNVLHPAFRQKSTSRLIRNGVGVSSPHLVLFAISDEPVNFYEFATLFRDRLGCPDALFLDGTNSSLYSTELKHNDFRMDLGPILGVTEALASPR